LGGVVLLVVVAVTVGATLLFTGGGPGDSPPTGTSSTPTTSGVASDIASAKDDGPVEIVTDDPTCSRWTSIANAIADQQSDWSNRDPSIPASSWTADQRRTFESMGDAMRRAADQTVALAKATPHRVMRELYEQTIAYWRAYADAVPTYSPVDDSLAIVAGSTGSAIGLMCDAIGYDSASSAAVSVASAAAPKHLSQVGNPSSPQRFMMSADGTCADWPAVLPQLEKSVADWQRVSEVAENQWSSEDKLAVNSIIPQTLTTSRHMEDLGSRSDNGYVEDFAALAAQYLRGFSAALPRYTTADSYLYAAAINLIQSLSAACKAAGG
jgi:hypothetical protein